MNRLQLFVVFFLLMIFLNPSIQNLNANSEYRFAELSYNPVPFSTEIVVTFTPAEMAGGDFYYNRDTEEFYYTRSHHKDIMRSIFAPEFEFLNLSISFQIENMLFNEYRIFLGLDSNIIERTVGDGHLFTINGGGGDKLFAVGDYLKSDTNFTYSFQGEFNFTEWVSQSRSVEFANGTEYEGDFFTMPVIQDGYAIDDPNRMVEVNQILDIGFLAHLPSHGLDTPIDTKWDQTMTITFQIEGLHDPVLYETLKLRYDTWEAITLEKLRKPIIKELYLWFGIGVMIYLVGRYIKNKA